MLNQIQVMSSLEQEGTNFSEGPEVLDTLVDAHIPSTDDMGIFRQSNWPQMSRAMIFVHTGCGGEFLYWSLGWANNMLEGSLLSCSRT